MTAALSLLLCLCTGQTTKSTAWLFPFIIFSLVYFLFLFFASKQPFLLSDSSMCHKDRVPKSKALSSLWLWQAVIVSPVTNQVSNRK